MNRTNFIKNYRRFSNSFLMKDKKLAELLKYHSPNILHNISIPQLYENAIDTPPANPLTPISKISNSGAIIAYSGQKTGRSPNDKRIISNDPNIWWGEVNRPMPNSTYQTLQQLSIDYLNNKSKLYVVDGYIGWDPEYQIKCRVLCSRAYHALFMNNMLIRPNKHQLETDFKDNIDYHIFNAGEFYSPINTALEGLPNSKTCVALNLDEQSITILGTQYAGEMKKGLFSIMHYLLPKKGVLSMHASANEGKYGDVTLLFGLSGTGKTTLSADPQRRLIGDDEHGWSDNGVFNLEGGCYAKAVGLNPKNEPEIFNAIKFGSVLENVKFYPNTRDINYDDISITENTRVSYPLEFIDNVKIPAVGGHPKNIFFLTCDAFGVLPPVAKLTPEQAMYHFISGYTAKVAGTEQGVKEPGPTFSACFGQAFLPLHPAVYAELLAEKVKKHKTNVWLINTGWSGGKYGIGKRMNLSITRRIIDNIHSGEMQNVQTTPSDIFNFGIPVTCSGVDPSILNPRNTWSNKQEFDDTLKSLAHQFNKNFDQYKDKSSQAIISAGPKLN